jgi:hypothetical protein
MALKVCRGPRVAVPSCFPGSILCRIVPARTLGDLARQKIFIARPIMSEPTKEELLAKIAELEKKAASGSKRTGALEFRVGEKGGVSVYGLGRFPVTLYYEQWTRLLDVAANLREFLEENKHRLKLKTKDE